MTGILFFPIITYSIVTSDVFDIHLACATNCVFPCFNVFKLITFIESSVALKIYSYFGNSNISQLFSVEFQSNESVSSLSHVNRVNNCLVSFDDICGL